MAAQLKYNPNYHDDWAWSLAIKGATDKEIAEAFKISVRTLNRWKKDHPSFEESLNCGKSAADAKVERMLYERATGYTCEETEVIQELDKNGNPKPTKIRKTKKVYPPDVLAGMYWLNNRQPGKYKRNPENFITSNDDDEDDIVIYLPENGRDSNPCNLCRYLHLWRRCRRRKNLRTAVGAASVHEQSGLQRNYLPT